MLELYFLTMSALTLSIFTQFYIDITYFILELVQNADDNMYPSDSIPAVRFHLSRQQLVVECNETGFMEKNVRVICDVNASTKKGMREREFIGEKGIGSDELFVSC